MGRFGSSLILKVGSTHSQHHGEQGSKAQGSGHDHKNAGLMLHEILQHALRNLFVFRLSALYALWRRFFSCWHIFVK